MDTSNEIATKIFDNFIPVKQKYIRLKLISSIYLYIFISDIQIDVK